MFKRAISCYDFCLSDEPHAYELYSPNHFARQLGFKQEIPFPLIESLNRYTLWQIKASISAIGDEKDRYTVRFQFASPQLPPPVDHIYKSKEVSPAYTVWWQSISANDWDRDVDQVFWYIYAKGIVLLQSIEDQRILHDDPFLAPTRKQGLKNITTKVKAIKPVSKTDKLLISLL